MLSGVLSVIPSIINFWFGHLFFTLVAKTYLIMRIVKSVDIERLTRKVLFEVSSYQHAVIFRRVSVRLLMFHLTSGC